METKITREQVLETMANANQVEGFDPRLVTTCYKDADGNARMYLQAEPAMMWFRLKHPGGRLEQIVYRANDMMATVEGRVIDENGNLLANAFATRYHADDQFGKDYIQNAGTAAIRKALGNCGFGTPANAEYIEGVTVCHEAAELTDAPVDDGVEAKIPVPPVPKEVVEAERNEKKTATRTRKTAKKQEQPKEAAPAETSPQTESEPKPEPKSEPAHTPIPVPPVPREQETVKEPKTLEDALSFKIPCGRYGGQTMKELLDSGNTAAITYFLRPLFTGKPVQAAARILAGQYNL